MKLDKLIQIHITDPPLYMYSGDVLKNTHVQLTGTTYGRFIFTSRVVVEVVTGPVEIRENFFDVL